MTPHSVVPPTATALPRDAIIVLPGIVPALGTTLSAVARRLAVALDNNAPSAASFRVADERSTTLGSRELRVVTILRRSSSSAEPVPVADLIEFDYRTFLTGALATRSPLRQAFAIAATLILNFGNLVAAVTRRSLRGTQKFQVGLGALMFFCVAVYFGVLAFAVFESSIELIARSSGTSWAAYSVPSGLKTSIVVLTFGGLWSRMNLKATLAIVAPALSCTADYLAIGRRRSEILGELTRLIDHLDEQPHTPYRHVHLLGYSFGSIIALDALFPREHAVGLKMKRVDTLVTVGCPFDFVRTYWPAYFSGRHAAPGVPRRWLNVFCELDVLGSNFLDEDKSSEATQRGIEIPNQEPRRPGDQDNLAFGPSADAGGSLREYASFIGFRSHSVYWDRESENALSCFEPLVQKLFADELAA